jgi:flagellar motor switch protein FliM
MSDVLSQGEIDALLSALSDGQLNLDAIQDKNNEKRVRAYDFKRPNKFSKDQIRTLQNIYENLGRALGTYLSTTLRTLVKVEMASVQELSYYEFTRSLSNPSTLVVFTMPPLEGNGILELQPSVAMTIVDRLLGGPGMGASKPKALTDIEQGILTDQVFTRIFDSMNDAWAVVQPLQSEVASVESNPLFVQIVAPNEMVGLITYRLQITDSEGYMNICLPHILLEKVLPKLTTRFWYSGNRRPQEQNDKNAIRNALSGASVGIRIELGRCEVALADVLDLAVGDCIELDTHIKDGLRVFVGEEPLFVGRPGRVGKHLAAKIVDTEGGVMGFGA